MTFTAPVMCLAFLLLAARSCSIFTWQGREATISSLLDVEHFSRVRWSARLVLVPPLITRFVRERPPLGGEVVGTRRCRLWEVVELKKRVDEAVYDNGRLKEGHGVEDLQHTGFLLCSVYVFASRKARVCMWPSK
eukprot:TRINITY_DN1955_c0_g1_i2.p1 TRINITY_DN1955_c0_g1~~TRINITY_DN1955_c0_g1_i2.p1  ORF type:complete len:135 (+),score=0.62 TRINITY_DN1955_c0_g1_i2:190-594(+)